MTAVSPKLSPSKLKIQIARRQKKVAFVIQLILTCSQYHRLAELGGIYDSERLSSFGKRVPDTLFEQDFTFRTGYSSQGSWLKASYRGTPCFHASNKCKGDPTKLGFEIETAQIELFDAGPWYAELCKADRQFKREQTPEAKASFQKILERNELQRQAKALGL